MSCYHPGLEWAHPLIQEWFIQKFCEPTEPQLEGWPAILAHQHTLISAPTGSGKTLAAFLICLDQLVRAALEGRLEAQTEVVYVSPLKALSNDVHKNLTGPLSEIEELAKQKGLNIAKIRVAVRTGDTLPSERQAMLKKPPHILVTTPESLYILLTAAKSRTLLQTVHTVIVDEIHAVANDKRGSHLALSLERLAALCPSRPLRIGLSATQKPLEQVARFLTGCQDNNTCIVDIGHAKQLQLSVEVPPSELGPVASNEMWDEIYNRLAELANANRSTLVFVNTRRLAERVAHHLSLRIGEDLVAAHHGSLSRKIRLQAEHKLKEGQLKVLVATASLELGIDIGYIDLVCQVGSPRAIASALQRVGRAGHWHNAISHGKFFVTTRDELVECAALVAAIKTGKLDTLRFPQMPLDILAQQIIATCATSDWHEDELFGLVTRAFPYEQLTREQFDRVIAMLCEGIAGSRGKFSAYLFRDQKHQLIKARRGSRLVAITNGGAIPETGLFNVIALPNEAMVGTLDEDFAVESNRGDIFLLGTTSWQVKRVENALGRVLVEDARGAPPSVPFWRGEAPGRTDELSQAVAALRQKVSDDLPSRYKQWDEGVKAQAYDLCNWLERHCGLSESGVEQLIDYILQGRALLGAVPTQGILIAERFFDEGGGMQLVIHSPFGARINKAWGLALRKRFCRSFNFELQAAATDNGINIALAEQHSFPLGDVFNFLSAKTVRKVLTQAVLQSPIFNTRWRWTATRSLALTRTRNGKKIPPNILRMLSDDLLAAVFPDAAACQDNLGGRDIELPDHPLIEETMNDILSDSLDVIGLIAVLEGIKKGMIKCLAVDSPLPSVFSQEILNANPYAFLDDAPLEERRARAVTMRRFLPDSVLDEVGLLDQAAISEVKQQAWPDIRNSDELHDLLQTLIAFPASSMDRQIMASLSLWQGFMEPLVDQGRAVVKVACGNTYWVSYEKTALFDILYGDQTMNPDREQALVQLIKEWLFLLGPITALELSELLAIDLQAIDWVLLKLEATGLILRGHFRIQTLDAPLEWCERRLLARIHRLTLGQLRREIEPVSAAQFMHWLLKWQHVAPGTQLNGEQGLLEVIKQLQGYEIAANGWEKQVLARRVANYDASLLDRLCVSGLIGWGRVSTQQRYDDTEITIENTIQAKHVKPTRSAPITLFLREDSHWMLEKFPDHSELTGLPTIATDIYNYLKAQGASFFADIVGGTGYLKSQVELGLWELVASGLITADGFENLRTLIDPKRHKHRRFRSSVFSFASGRWSLLHRAAKIDHEKRIEAACWMLLKRYGIVFRDLLVREKNIPTWRELLLMYRRLEARGEVRGGRFVSGFLGEQFALPYAVDSLRAMKKVDQDFASVTVAAVDPLNLVGILLPGQKVAALAHHQITLPALSTEQS